MMNKAGLMRDTSRKWWGESKRVLGKDPALELIR
jgi:hypothetical protein